MMWIVDASSHSDWTIPLLSMMHPLYRLAFSLGYTISDFSTEVFVLSLYFCKSLFVVLLTAAVMLSFAHCLKSYFFFFFHQGLQNLHRLFALSLNLEYCICLQTQYLRRASSWPWLAKGVGVILVLPVQLPGFGMLSKCHSVCYFLWYWFVWKSF